MSQAWYNAIAIRNGGYKSDAIYMRQGLSGEIIFKERLEKLLPSCHSVLDMGCGHGEFTAEMAKYCKITGADNAEELLNIAMKTYQHENLSFVYASTKGDFPFKDHTFDLVYTRRGPTSTCKHLNIIKPGGLLMGIHSFDLNKDEMIQKLESNGFEDIIFEAFTEARLIFPNKDEFASFLAASHGNVDYTQIEHQASLDDLIKKYRVDGRIVYPEHRYIWSARVPIEKIKIEIEQMK